MSAKHNDVGSNPTVISNKTQKEEDMDLITKLDEPTLTILSNFLRAKQKTITARKNFDKKQEEFKEACINILALPKIPKAVKDDARNCLFLMKMDED